METLFIYMVKASVLISVFFMVYYILLRHETFFTGNRRFLLAGLFTSSILPALTYTHIIWTEPVSIAQLPEIINSDIAVPPALPVHEVTLNWPLMLLYIYSAGVLFFVARFITDIIKINYLIKKQNFVYEDNFKIIDSEDISVPFSFFRYIAINSSGLYAHEIKSIISHEKVHSRQWHSLDIIITQLFCAVLWFNPFIWMYKKAIVQNLEFIADAEAALALSDRTTYQKTLLKFTVQHDCMALTNHFYQSLIKKRIIMLNKKQSHKSRAFKYTIVLPALCAFMYFFQIETVAQQLTAPPEKIQDKTLSLLINKDITDDVLKQNKSFFKKPFNADVVFSEIKRNIKGEIIRINVKVTDGIKNTEYNTESDEPISPFYIVVEKNKDGGNEMAIGKYKTIATPREINTSYKGPEGDNQGTIRLYGQMSYVSDEKGNGLRLKNDGNSGFIVNMKTTDKNFEYYKQQLKEIDVELRYSEIKRDKKGNIQHLRIDVTDKSEKTPLKISTLTESYIGEDGIDDVYIGRRNGTLIAGGPDS